MAKILPIARRRPARARERAPRRVAVLALDGVVSFDLSVATAIFGGLGPSEVELLDDASSPAPWNVARYEVRVCSLTGRVRTSDGLRLEVPFRLRTLAWADTVVVPGHANVKPPLSPTLLSALRGAHVRGARVVSICTGAFVLAAAGLLDGKRATTHWAAAARLAAAYPRITVDPTVLYVDEGSVCTSAGVAAGIDLCLHLVRRDYGAEAANLIARVMVVPPHRSGGQAQFAEAPVPVAHDGSLERTRRWMLARLTERLTVAALAQHAATSRRTFTRRFAAETGTTPLQWLIAQRVLLARRLLETTDEPVARVATLTGFGDALSLRQHFKRAVGTTPLSYRGAFRGPAKIETRGDRAS